MGGDSLATDTALPPPHRRHFPLLDAGRGVAAIAVLAHHIGNETQTHLMRRGFLAVDYFLLLSGFVIGLSYEPKFGKSLGFKKFIRLRALRLWPMIFAAGILATLAWAGGAPPIVGWPVTIMQFALVPMLVGTLIFPLNAPLWSLFYEMIANLIHGLVLWRLSMRGLTALLILLVMADGVVMLIHPMWNNGFRPRDGGMALVRMMTSYVMGLILYRLYAMGRLPHIPMPAVVPMLLILAPMMTPSVMPERLVVVAAVGFVFPMALVMGVASKPFARGVGSAAWLGGISYPLYTIHMPIIKFWLLAGIIASNTAKPWWGWAAMAASALIAATLFERWYDAPIRTWLRERSMRTVGR